MGTNLNFTHDKWDDCTSDVQCALNSAFHKSLGDTPSFALYGFNKVLPFDILATLPYRQVPINSYVADRYHQTQLVHQKFYLNLSKATDNYVGYASKLASQGAFIRIKKENSSSDEDFAFQIESSRKNRIMLDY